MQAVFWGSFFLLRAGPGGRELSGCDLGENRGQVTVWQGGGPGTGGGCCGESTLGGNQVCKNPGGGCWEHGRAWENASPDFRNATEKRPQINWVGWGRGWWYRSHSGPRLCGPCPLLAAGFWRSKFDPRLTQTQTFHLDEQFTVPVDMMQARSYPLRWFSLEQSEIQVTFDCPGWA